MVYPTFSSSAASGAVRADETLLGSAAQKVADKAGPNVLPVDMESVLQILRRCVGRRT